MATAKKTTARKAPATTRKPKAQAAASGAPKAAKTAKAAKPAKTPKAQKAPKADKPADKAKKPKLVRDSFTIPKNEFTVLEDLKLRAAKLGRPMKKSEVLRAGVMALAAMGDAAFLASVSGVPAVKTGRPAKEEAAAS
jgi:hypothetical protein